MMSIILKEPCLLRIHYAQDTKGIAIGNNQYSNLNLINL